MRIAARKILALIPALLALVTGAAGAGDASQETIRNRHGDDPRWAAPDWDDSDWAPGATVPARTGIHWVRFRLFIQDEAQPDESGQHWLESAEAATSDSIFMAAPYSHEVFWDGRLIGRSGKVAGTREAEVTGPLDHVFMIPLELRGRGEHLVAIRLSSFHYNFPATEFAPGFVVGNYAQHFASEMRRPVFPLISVGGALLVALISGVLYGIVDRWRPLLLCSLISFALAVFYLLIAWRWIHNAPYEWFCPRLVAITGVMTAIAWLFPWLLLEQFAVPHGRRWLVALLPVLAAAWTTSEIYEIKVLWLCRVMLVVSLGIAGWAVWRRRLGARFVLAGVLLGLIAVRAGRRDFLDPSFFATFGVLALFVFSTLGLQFRGARRRAEEATLTAARLEIELLKKNIQPHFLMNTLTTIMEVVEQEPKSAVSMIEALAGEFRILARVSGEKLIGLGEELELCRAHLRMMSLRRGVACRLETVGVDERAPVPPALFHTLVEGGITHQTPRAGELKFVLKGDYETTQTRYTLVVHGTNPTSDRPMRDGTGLRYVKARLEESFAGRWSLVAGPVAEGWGTVIEIRKHPGEGARA